MVQQQVRNALLAAVAFVAAAGSAHAWGPTAQRAIVGTAFQVIAKGYADPFKTVDFNYESDVIAGAVAGRAALNSGVTLGTDKEVMNEIGTEIQLLREVRRNGSGGSYFAYRMGVVVAVVSDVSFPLCFEKGSARVELR